MGCVGALRVIDFSLECVLAIVNPRQGVYPFVFKRQYRTTAVEVSSVFGYGWSHSLQHQFVFNDNDHTIT